MMGTKARVFTLLPPVSLEELVPSDHFYRHLEHTLDLGFVRGLVRGAYADSGRPSIDPVVFFKLHPILFFEGLRSERQLMRVVADRLSLRWYLGYDLTAPLPDHSSLTRIRERYGVEVFRRFFESVVEQCIAAGLVWGRELYVDATKVEADASLDSLRPRFFVEAHLERLFRGAGLAPAGAPAEDPGRQDDVAGAPAPATPQPLPTAAPPELAAANAGRHDWLARQGRPDRAVTHGHYQRLADLEVSTTDPDATVMRMRDGARLGYHTHYVVDG